MKANPVTVPCGCCKGTGRVELSGVCADTLELVKRQRVRINGKALSVLAGCSNQAMCNRLTSLMRRGLTTYTQYGREKLWAATDRPFGKLGE